MIGVTLTFTQQIANGVDALNNPTFSTSEIEVDDCLVAPITEPVSIRESQAIAQAKDQVRVHLPKSFTGDVSSSSFVWDNKVFQLDSDSVVFMSGNTPTRWNRYFRAEYIGNYNVAEDYSEYES